MLGDVIFYSWLAGITVFVGGLFANYFNHHVKDTPVKCDIIHTMMSFGGGIILSAVALVLLPMSMDKLGLTAMVVSFLLGALVFLCIDQLLAKKGGKTATLLAMMLDFVPESIILGAVFTLDPSAAILLAFFIAFQNFPEAFNAYRDFVQNGFTPRRTNFIFFFLSFFGVFGVLIGYFFLSAEPQMTAELMMFASGGLLYLLFQDIIPESKLDGNYLVSLGAIGGFLVGMIGEKIL